MSTKPYQLVIKAFHQLSLGDFFILLLTLVYTTLSPSISFFPYSVSWHDEKRILEVLILLMALIQVTSRAILCKNAWMSLHPAVNLGLLFVLAIAVVSSINATSPPHALLELAIFYALFQLVKITIDIYKSLEFSLIDLVSYSFIASATFYLVGFYAGYLASYITKIPLQWPLPFIGFSNIRSFNQYQCWTLGLVYLPLLAARLEKKYYLALTFVLVNWWILAFATNSRGVLFAWLIATFLTGIVYRTHAKQFLKLQVITIFLGAMGYYLLFLVIPDLLNLSASLSTAIRTETGDRVALWNTAINLCKSHPWLGVGPMHYAWHNPTFAHPHNSLLQLLAEWGIPATLVLLGILFRAAWLWLCRFNYQTLHHLGSSTKAVVIVLFFTLTLNFGYSLVDGVIVMPLSQILMFILIGLSLGVFGVRSIYSNKVSLFHVILSIITIAIISTITYVETNAALIDPEGKFSSGYQNSNSPRFWLEGS